MYYDRQLYKNLVYLAHASAQQIDEMQQYFVIQGTYMDKTFVHELVEGGS